MKTVVMFLGPSSAGKSTTCKALQDSHAWKICSIDDELEKVHQERLKDYESALAKAGLFEKLAPLMSKEDVLNLCVNGILKISREGVPTFIHRFDHPDYPNLDIQLEKANFTKEEITRLSPLLKAVGLVYKEWKHPDSDARLLGNAFKAAQTPNESVIIDTVPKDTQAENEAMIQSFKTYTEAYKHEHGENSIQSFVVLAYCPPMKLKQRLENRNVEAVQNKQPGNKRAWKLALGHLTKLYRAEIPSSNPTSSVDTMSHTALTKHAYMHHVKKPAAKPKLQKFKDAAEATIEANKLTKAFGIDPKAYDTEHAVVSSLTHDAIINTSNGSPEEVAQKVVDIAQPANHTPGITNR